MAEPIALKYRAFISYSHADTSSAKWLHRVLEGFRIDKDLVGRETATGTIPKALRPVFRDRDDFTAGHTLSDQTLAALDASAALIVICSPSAAKSQYVNEEIRLFKTRHPEQPVIPLIVRGKPGDHELECFPPALKFKIDGKGRITRKSVEVLAADAREEGDGKSLALAKVAAGLLGLSSDDIFRRGERERRRRQRNWIAGLSAVALVLAGLAVWAEINRREAVAQRAEAERNFEVAKQGANALVFDIAQALRNQEGMRTETVRKILGTAEQVIGKLVAKSEGNRELLRLQSSMLDEFAQTYAAQGDTAMASEAAQKEMAIAKRLAEAEPDRAERQRDLTVAYLRVGSLRDAQGDLTGALEAYRAGLAIVGDLANANPGNADWETDLLVIHNKIAGVLAQQSDLAAALKSYQAGLAIAERLAEANPDNPSRQSDLAISRERIGDLLMRQRRLAEALQSYRDSLAVRDRLAEADPSDAMQQLSLSVCHDRIGDVLAAQGASAQALQSYRESFAIIDRLAKSDPKNAEWQSDLSISYLKLGHALQAQDQLTVALQAYRDSLAIRSRLVQADPNNAKSQAALILSYDKIGGVLQKQGEVAQALGNFRAELNLAEQLVKADSSNADWQDLLVTADENVADMLKAQGDLAGAFAFYRRGLAIAERMAKADPGNPARQGTLQGFIAKIGALAYNFVLAHDFAKGLEAADTAIADAPDQLWLQLNRAHALMFLGQIDEARAIYLQHRAQNVQDQKSWEDVVLADFEELRKNALTHGLMNEIETLFKETKSAEPVATQRDQAAAPAVAQ
jgi:tetratricopeptide (TPR) repeat protein